MVDIQTTVDALAKFGNVVGYCFGGLLTWLSACSVSGLSAASCYYGGGISDNLDQENKCPTIMHFGLKDPYIPVEQIEKIKAKLSHLIFILMILIMDLIAIIGGAMMRIVLTWL